MFVYFGKKQKYYDKGENFKRYIADIKKFDKLSKSDFFELYRRYKEDGDMESFNKIIESNLLYAIRFASRYVGGRIPYDDLIAWCNEALIDALNKYDASKSPEFISFANYFMAQKLRFANDSSYPIKMTTKAKKMIHSAECELSDIAQFVNIDHVQNDDGTERMFELGNEDDTFDADRSFKYDYIYKVMNVLNDREKLIVKKYCGFGCQEKNFNEISKEIGVSSQYVFSVFKKAIKKLEYEIKKNRYDENI